MPENHHRDENTEGRASGRDAESTGEIEQRRRNIRVLELLERSHTAHEAGNADECSRLISEANALDALVVSVIQGGMRIGEVPLPGTAEFGNYLDNQRAYLAGLEHAPES